jgi:hypothetical protein
VREELVGASNRYGGGRRERFIREPFRSDGTLGDVDCGKPLAIAGVRRFVAVVPVQTADSKDCAYAYPSEASRHPVCTPTACSRDHPVLRALACSRPCWPITAPVASPSTPRRSLAGGAPVLAGVASHSARAQIGPAGPLIFHSLIFPPITCFRHHCEAAAAAMEPNTISRRLPALARRSGRQPPPVTQHETTGLTTVHAISTLHKHLLLSGPVGSCLPCRSASRHSTQQHPFWSWRSP